ncbi:MAG: GTP cyclohydrolase I FolE [Candidatus Omnitrophica bacterium]|nr:GTP cyclohydrolase I FolE [Candidatus Omnitrophota bacterium]MDD5080831.1 GTP cyclohydrolase I FolE [Candidatus Omnitrophota bacterium]
MDKNKIIEGVKKILEGIGTDLRAKDMVDTPRRVAQMYEEILSGEHKDGADEISVILEQEHDEIILIRDIPVQSLCEHHMVPFIGRAHVAYIPDKKITGLSKIARVVDVFSKRLQIQERLTTQIADAIVSKLSPKAVMVIIEAEHLCMTMRGVKKPGAKTVTSVVRGIFRSDSKARQEALSLINLKSC